MSNVIELSKDRSRKNTDEVRKLIVANLQSIRRFAYSLTKNMHDADDLVQRVAEKLLNNSIPEDCDALPWIFRVCKNAWIDELRSRQVRRSDDTVPETLASEREGDKPDAPLEKRDIHNAIEKLPENYRSVILLVVVSGLSYAETAAALDVPIGTVMSRVARARQQLSKILSGHND